MTLATGDTQLVNGVLKQYNAKRFITYNFRRHSIWRLLFLPRLQTKEKRKTTREVKSNQMTKTELTVVVGFYIFLMVMFWIGGIR